MSQITRLSALGVGVILSLSWGGYSLAQEPLVLRDKLRELEGAVSRQNNTQAELRDKVTKLQKENLLLAQTLDEKIKERDALKKEVASLKEDFSVTEAGVASASSQDDFLKPPELVSAREKNYDKVIHLNLGYAYGMKGDISKAIEEYRMAAESDPHDKDIHFNLGYLLAVDNKYAQAVEEYNKSIGNQPDDREAYYNMALIYANDLKDQKNADIYMKKYTELSAPPK